MRSLYFLLSVFVLFLVQGCDLVNPKEDIPTYIKIDSVFLQSTVPAIHGSVSHKITDVWVYFNRELLGAYQLPARVPVIAKQRGQLQVVAGIWEDGLSGIRAKYPFYTVDTFTFDPQPAGSIAHIPKFIYRTSDSLATEYKVEDFEQGNSFTRRYGDTTFMKTNLPGEVFEGSWSSKLELQDTVTVGESITVESYTLPTNRNCYLELNYKNDIPFVLRVLINQNGSQTTVDLTGINPTGKWGKIYYNFGGFPTTFQNATFRFILSAILPAGKSKGTVLIDNFKIIYFK